MDAPIIFKWRMHKKGRELDNSKIIRVFISDSNIITVFISDSNIVVTSISDSIIVTVFISNSNIVTVFISDSDIITVCSAIWPPGSVPPHYRLGELL